MGRKKRKTVEEAETNNVHVPEGANADADVNITIQKTDIQQSTSAKGTNHEELKTDKPTDPRVQPSTAIVVPAAESDYSTKTHSAEIHQEDIYVSDGSESSDDDMEIIIAGSQMGLMRRGLHTQSQLVRQNREWKRPDRNVNVDTDDAANAAAVAQELARKQEEEELAKLDPAQRAARLLQEKQKKLEQAKELARRLESEENAGRDPSVFSKRTAFDIRFDQIEDKPWERTGELTDYFNYALTEEDWREYAQLQLNIRQELTDASRQQRAPDPTIVPVTPRAPHAQTPRVPVKIADTTNDVTGDGEQSNETSATAITTTDPVDEAQVDIEIGPARPEPKLRTFLAGEETTAADIDIYVGSGGAWGCGAEPGSKLAKLIEEQERQTVAAVEPPTPEQSVEAVQENCSYYGDNEARSDDGFSHGRSDDYHGRGRGRGRGRDYFGGRGRHGGRWEDVIPGRGAVHSYGDAPDPYARRNIDVYAARDGGDPYADPYAYRAPGASGEPYTGRAHGDPYAGRGGVGDPYYAERGGVDPYAGRGRADPYAGRVAAGNAYGAPPPPIRGGRGRFPSRGGRGAGRDVYGRGGGRY
jgi:hypothetical protein